MPTKSEIEEFSNKIMNLSTLYNCSIMEAIVDHCHKSEMEIEIAATLISNQLKKMMEVEAKVLNLMKEKIGGKLPL